VNNAGRGYAAAIEEIDPAVFDEIFHLNVLGPIVAMQAVIPLMRSQGGGAIVHVNTATNFGKNRMDSPAGGGPSSNYAEGDTPEFVAGLVLRAIEEGHAQYFANDRLRTLAGVAD
jgi:NAD(P)-dependent dehydrogenase (short-subunit alcohol dehydrogenase family)